MRPITASDLMNPAVLAVREDMSVEELAAFLMDNEITGAPVENHRGLVVGVVSLVDIVRAYTDEDSSGWTVADIMTPEVYSVAEDAQVSEIASTLLDNHLHRLLVIRDGTSAGIISTSDLLGLLIDEDDD